MSYLSWRTAIVGCSVLLAVFCGTTAGATPPKPLTIPFVTERNRLIVPTSVNGSRNLKLLLDTGMRFDGVYLFHKDALNLVDTTGAVLVQVGGAGDGKPTTATMIQSGRLTFGEQNITNQAVVISHSDITQQFSTDGVIGWTLFGHHVVEIDYDRQVILLYDTTYVHPDSGWQVIPLTIKEQIPWLEVSVEVKNGEIAPMQVYVDLASREALELLVCDGQKFSKPDSLSRQLLGIGLSGEIYGEYGKSDMVRIGEYELRDVLTAFAPAATRSKQKGADGILGNDFIRRFNAVFDYGHGRLYIRPNATFGKPFDSPTE